MINFLCLLLFYVVVSLTGFTVVNYFWNKSFNIFEKIGSGFAFGLIINFFNCFIINTLGLKLSRISILSGLLVWLAAFVFLSIKKRRLFVAVNWKKTGLDFFSIFLVLLIALLFISIFYRALSVGFDAWDEFSFWGKAARSVAFSGSIFMQNMLSAENLNYPVFLPVNAGSAIIVSGSFFAENLAKVLNVFNLSFMTIFLYGFLKRIGLARNDSLLFVLLFLVISQELLRLSTILYADVALMYFLALGTLTLLRPLFEPDRSLNKNLIVFSMILFFLTAFIRPGGSATALISVFVVFVLLPGKKQLRKGIGLALIFFVVAVVGELLSKEITKTFPLTDRSSSIRPNIIHYVKANTLPVLPHLGKLAFLKLLNEKYHTILWPLITFTSGIGLVLYRRKIYLAILLIAGLNIFFWFSSSVLLFTIEELRTMNGYEKYIAQIIPVSFVGIAFLYQDLMLSFNKLSKKVNK